MSKHMKIKQTIYFKVPKPCFVELKQKNTSMVVNGNSTSKNYLATIWCQGTTQ